MMNSILDLGNFQLETVFMTLGTALCLGLLIACLYRTLRPQNGDYVVILAVLPMLTASIILLVNGNVGASISVLGAFGLVRFRSAPGSAWEIGFIFYGMAVGLASGLGYVSIAGFITVLVGIILFLLDRTGFGHPTMMERQLRITIPEDLNYSGIFDDLMNAYTSGYTLERVRTVNMGSMFELTYRVRLNSTESEKDFIDEIRCRNGNLAITMGIVQDDKGTL
ncbi:MAG: DUF4956 domain-containing protein [Lachnospiraceae bacterium]|nr:DUF4956 domain-containing protein [Lachnospiraceae bacterium]